MTGNLKIEDFKVEENGNEAAIDNFYFTGNASGQKLDLAKSQKQFSHIFRAAQTRPLPEH
jgi:hypothetical protein